MSFSYGGWARISGVSFQSQDFTVHATRKNGRIKLDYSKNEDENKVISICDDILSRIPFIRGIWLLIYNLLNQWKAVLVLIPCTLLLAVGVTFFYLKNTDINHVSNLINIQIYAIGIITFGIFIKFSNMGKYHAAEHMSSNALDNIESLELRDITRQSRIHERCGTNLFIYVLFLFVILFLCIHTYTLSLLMGQSIGYELFILKSHGIRLILFPFYGLGRMCQYLFFTSKPQKEHLEVAQAALQKLVELESTVKD